MITSSVSPGAVGAVFLPLLSLLCLLSFLPLPVSSAVSVSFTAVDDIDLAVVRVNGANATFAPLVLALFSAANAALHHPLPTVTTSTQIPPNGDPHTYLSYGDYWWPTPDCNLSDPQFMRDCDYERRDGQVNPDTALCTQKTAANAVVMDSITLALAALLSPVNRSVYAQQAALQLQSFYLNPNTSMLPNLQYGQVVRGKNYLPWVGRAEGIIDVRAWAYIPTVLDILDLYPPTPSWKDDSKAVRAWFLSYSVWLTTSEIGKEEQAATNNHGTWHYVQTVTYAWAAGQNTTAQHLFTAYLTSQYQEQITANGSQPLELARTRPFHYSCFNLQALTYLAKFAARQWGQDVWHLPNDNNATIQTAVDYIIDQVDPKVHGEDSTDVVPLIIDVMAVYGDPTGRYKQAILTFNHGSSAPLFSQLWQRTAPRRQRLTRCTRRSERSTEE